MVSQSVRELGTEQSRLAMVIILRASLVAQMAEHLPAMLETRVRY